MDETEQNLVCMPLRWLWLSCSHELAMGTQVQLLLTTWLLTTICHCTSRGPNTLFWLLQAPGTHGLHRHTCRQTYTSSQIVFLMKSFESFWDSRPWVSCLLSLLGHQILQFPVLFAHSCWGTLVLRHQRFAAYLFSFPLLPENKQIHTFVIPACSLPAHSRATSF